MFLPLIAAVASVAALPAWAQPAFHLPPWLLIAFQYSEKKGDVYYILWALVFGFATLNILALVGRRFEPDRTRLNFGEMLAIMVVVVSVFLLGGEMLYLFKILPIKLQPRGQ